MILHRRNLIFAWGSSIANDDNFEEKNACINYNQTSKIIKNKNKKNYINNGMWFTQSI